MSVVDRHWIAPSPLSSPPGERTNHSLSPEGRGIQGEGKRQVALGINAALASGGM